MIAKIRLATPELTIDAIFMEASTRWRRATLTGGNSQVGVDGYRTIKVGCTITIPCELLNASGAFHITATTRQVIRVIHDPIYRAIGRLEERIVPQRKYFLCALKDRGG